MKLKYRPKLKLKAKGPKVSVVWSTGGGFPVIPNLGVTLTKATFANNTGSTQTNVPFQFGLPILGGNLPVGSIIQVLDSDGVTPLAVQTDRQGSDFSSNARHVIVSGVKPSLATGNSQVTIKSLPGVAATGTAIAAGDITALAGAAFEPAKVTIVIGGVTYTASCAEALGAGSTWSLTTSVNRGQWLNGPYASMFAVSAPFKTGGTAHDYARCDFHVYAYKAGSGVVTAQGGANPITAIRVHVLPENGYAQQHTSAVADLYYSALVQTSTSMTNAALVTNANWTNDTSGPGTITNGAVDGLTLLSTITRSTGTWSQDDYGRIIQGTGGGLTGLGQIYNVSVGATTAGFKNITTFSSSSWASGNYTMYGVGHAYATRWRNPIYFGATVGHPESTQITFSLWDGTGGTCTLMPYLSKTKMALNWSTAVGSITNSAVNWGARPYRVQAITYHYEQPDYSGATGDAAYIGVCQEFDVAGTIKFDANGQARVFNNADAYMWFEWHYRDSATGLTPAFNNGTDWNYNPAFGGTTLQYPATTTALARNPSGGWENNHCPAGPYMAWLLTGDFCWAEELHSHGFFWGWATWDSNAAGSQLNRFPILDQLEQQRGHAWGPRNLVQGWAATPDSATGLLGNSKALYKTLLTNGWSQCVTKYVNDNTNYSANGPRWTCDSGGNGTAYAPWQVNYMLMALGSAYEMQAMDTNGITFRNWLQPATIVPYTDNNTNLACDWTGGAYYLLQNNGASLTTWAQVYQASALSSAFLLGISAPAVRVGGPSATLTATSGAAVTVTFSGSNPFTNGGSWYVGGWIGRDNFVGAGKITSVNVGANTCVIDTTATGGGTFGSTSIPAANLMLPWPHPLDATARGTFKGPVNDPHYWALQISAAYLWQDIGVANAASAAAYYAAQKALTGSFTDNRTLIAPR